MSSSSLAGTSLLDGLAARRFPKYSQRAKEGGGGEVTGGHARGRVGDLVVGQGVGEERLLRDAEERLLRDAVLSSPWLWEDRFHISIIISYLNINFLRNNDFHTMGG